MNSVGTCGERMLHLLDIMGWRLPTSGGGHDRGLAFARTGKPAHEIGSRWIRKIRLILLSMLRLAVEFTKLEGLLLIPDEAVTNLHVVSLM